MTHWYSSNRLGIDVLLEVGTKTVGETWIVVLILSNGDLNIV